MTEGGKNNKHNPQWEYWLEKSLSAIKETRAKYYAKAKKNGRNSRSCTK